MGKDDNEPASARRRAMIDASWMAQAIRVAAELGVADLLASGAKSAAELADATGTQAPSLYRLLRALASLDLCTEEDGKFALRATGVPLRSGLGGQERTAEEFHVLLGAAGFRLETIRAMALEFSVIRAVRA